MQVSVSRNIAVIVDIEFESQHAIFGHIVQLFFLKACFQSNGSFK